MRTVILAALILGGCATKPAEPIIITKEVRVPVPVPCKVQLPEERPLPSQSADISGDAFDLAKVVLIDREELKARLAEWQAAARACAQ